MIYCENFRITTGAIAELFQKVKISSQRAERLRRELASPSREMQMVPKYLELATFAGKERFNSAEITELTDLIRGYGSEIPVVDLVKQLLNIGTEKGEPLSTTEMKDFLLATPLINGEGQKRVMLFMKALKEQDTFKYDGKYVAENSSFEKFKKEVVEKYPDLYEGMSETQIKEAYMHRLRKEIDMCQYKAYTSQFDIEPQNISQFINTRNIGLIYGIANCEKPELFAKIVQKITVTSDMPELTNELVKAYELSNGNVKLVQDLIRVFYPPEIRQIVSELDKSRNVGNLSKYESRTSSEYAISNLKLAVQRKDVLEALGLTGKIDLLPLKQCGSVITVTGNFERGKRR